VIAFRHADPRFPFLIEDDSQPPARWHGEGEGPVQYLSDTADGAWAELLRHEEIADPEDVTTIRRALWAVEIPDEAYATPRLGARVLTGGPGSHPRCRREARRIKESGARGLVAPAAALLPGAARGWRVERGLVPGPDRTGRTIVLFGPRPDLTGWSATAEGRPRSDLVERVRFGRRSRRGEL
jgi:hypothetical protein